MNILQLHYLLLVFLSLIGATGAIEADQWLLGGAMALLGIAFSILGLYSQEMEKEAK